MRNANINTLCFGIDIFNDNIMFMATDYIGFELEKEIRRRICNEIKQRVYEKYELLRKPFM